MEISRVNIQRMLYVRIPIFTVTLWVLLEFPNYCQRCISHISLESPSIPPPRDPVPVQEPERYYKSQCFLKLDSQTIAENKLKEMRKHQEIQRKSIEMFRREQKYTHILRCAKKCHHCRKMFSI